MDKLYQYINAALAAEATTDRQRAYQEALRVYRRAYVALHEHDNESVRPEFEQADRKCEHAWFAMSEDEMRLFLAIEVR